MFDFSQMSFHRLSYVWFDFLQKIPLNEKLKDDTF